MSCGSVMTHKGPIAVPSDADLSCFGGDPGEDCSGRHPHIP